jgi:hypothetical protein
MNHPVCEGHLKLNGPNKVRTPRGFKAPRKKICRECWNVTGFDKAKLRTRGYFQA